MPPLCVRTARAEADLIEIWRFVAQGNPGAADNLLDRIEALFGLLSAHPGLGPARPDLAADLRYFVVGRYLILYREITGGIEIVRVLHSARYIPDLI